LTKKPTYRAMKPKYKSKIRQKQRERARANRAESKESNKPKITSAERMRKLREHRKAETSSVASAPGVASTSRGGQAMDIDTASEQSTQSQSESTQYSTRSLCNSHNSTFVIHSFCCLCNKCILIHKTLISFHISTHI
jgi:ATP-dependent Lon protease